MKISKPFGMLGELAMTATAKVGARTSNVAIDNSLKGELTVPVAWAVDAPFDIQLRVKFHYELMDVDSQGLLDSLVHNGNGEFGAMAEWRANLSEDGLELQSSGAAPDGSSKSEGDIAVSAGSSLVSQSFAKEKKPFVKWKIIVGAGRVSQGIGVGYGPVSTSIGGGSSTTKARTVELTVYFDVEKPPPQPKPVKKPIKVRTFKIGPYDHSKTSTEGVKKKAFSDYLTHAEFKTLITKTLPQATRDEWERREQSEHLPYGTIKIVGYADTTGASSENDKKYAGKRATDVQEWIKRWTGASDQFFVTKSGGEGKEETDKRAEEKRLAKNRYVEVELKYVE
jgi:hypothetical protein